MAEIKFGTDGWRAVTGKDFNEDNVLKATQAIAKYVYETFGIDKKFLIGYDPRNMADVFSKQCADVLTNLGFNVLYSKKVVPTPVLAYSAKLLDACAIMFTASHNPPEYLGLKFIPDYAGPATSDITDKITENLGLNMTPVRRGTFKEYDFLPDYEKHLEKLIDFDKIRNINTNIIFDGF